MPPVRLQSGRAPAVANRSFAASTFGDLPLAVPVPGPTRASRASGGGISCTGLETGRGTHDIPSAALRSSHAGGSAGADDDRSASFG